MYNIGIIGFGKMGQTRAQAISQSARGVIHKIYDVETKSLGPYEFAESENEIIDDPEVDAIFIATPNHRNKALTIASLRAGKHVFCEKPPALTVTDVLEIQAVEKETQKLLVYGFNHRHHRSIKQAKSLVDSGEFGNILWMRGRYGKSVDKQFFENWRADADKVGGGILLDQGIHMLDLFLHFAKDFDEVQAMVSNLYWKLDGVEDNVFANLRNTQTGVVASLHSTMTQWRHLFSLEIFLEKGYVVLNGLKTSSNSYGSEILTIAKNRTTAPAATWEDEERMEFLSDGSWLSEVNTFFDAIDKNERIAQCNSDDALKVMTLIEKIYEQGKPPVSGQ